MFWLSLVPVLGAPVLWIPFAGYLALTGEWGKALILTGWYPILVGDKIQTHPLLVFFPVVGGLSLIGSGLVIGPVAVVVSGMLRKYGANALLGGGRLKKESLRR